MDTKNKIITIVGSIALVSTVGVGGYALFAAPDTSNTVTTTSGVASTSSAALATSITSSVSSSSHSTNASYKDGTYTASRTYTVPHGAVNTISATITISDGTITSVKTTDNYADHESAQWISGFESSVNSDASGQKLATYTPSRIGGASLTSSAFSNVIDAVRSEATA